MTTEAPNAPPAPPASSAPPRRVRPTFLYVGAAAALVLLAFGIYWFTHRLSESVTDDAFVEAHIVNIAPQTVSGHLVRFLVEENDRVDKGQPLAEIDPAAYRDQVNIARSKMETAQAELRRLQKEVPIQIDIASRTLAAAEADQARAQAARKLTEAEVEQGQKEAEAGLAVARAELVLAEQEYTRYTNLHMEDAVPLRRAQEVTRTRDAAEARVKLAAATLAKARAEETRNEVAQKTLESAEKTTDRARESVKLAQTGDYQIAVKKEDVEDARRALEAAETNLRFTLIRAPFPGVVVKRYRHLGDFASPGVAILSMYNPDLIYVTANLEETRLHGVAPGNPVELNVDAFGEPFRGRVIWIDKSTGAQFALMPRNVVSGEFTKVVQRVPVRIQIEKDNRWPLLRAGLSVHVAIAHGDGDPQWAEQAAAEMRDLETRYNSVPQPPGEPGSKS